MLLAKDFGAGTFGLLFFGLFGGSNFHTGNGVGNALWDWVCCLFGNLEKCEGRVADCGGWASLLEEEC